MCRSLPPISIIFFSSSLSEIPDISSPFLQNRLAQHFVHGGHARRDFHQPASPQRQHSLFDGLLLQFQRRSANQNQLAQFVVDLHYFVQAGASLVAALVARGAALAVVNLEDRKST